MYSYGFSFFMKRFVVLLILMTSAGCLLGQERGKASYYANKFEGRKTASGELYQHHLKTGAHKTLPFGTLVKVTNVENNKTVIVKINDRGPFVKGRIIDLSQSAAKQIGGLLEGVFDVKLELVQSTE
ncbi:septal ring lytic transglycosylase RlpA family protein [Saccharicrinis fermentans]|uniref:Probable endolytic peptidoglycan transglycosylase RlpA n=2 Tax=Saccharicrinis fermentans TaxID=982 RepID=W7YLY3_9BACT|nr:septal ring lytic transglycosylase RlpA family protein [Saccharicrinis fermentans]GAF03409.1 RlpA-like protein precursor [Saccharicrinis fermentans DSM 9555 = JCM 21142]